MYLTVTPCSRTLPPVMAKKRCPRCERTRAVSTFGRNICNVDGLATYCRECSAERQRQWKAANPSKVREWRRKYLTRVKAANRKRDAEIRT